jgi:excisionase family DNA binding protein
VEEIGPDNAATPRGSGVAGVHPGTGVCPARGEPYFYRRVVVNVAYKMSRVPLRSNLRLSISRRTRERMGNAGGRAAGRPLLRQESHHKRRSTGGSGKHCIQSWRRPYFPGATPPSGPGRRLCFSAGEELAESPIRLESERVVRRCGNRRSRSPFRENVSELATKRNLTIAEAAELTGLSRKAIARRVERGSIRSVLRSGKRLIPRSELIRVGLLPPAGYSGVDQLTEAVLSHSVTRPGTGGGEQSLLEALVRELLDRVQSQAGELAQYKALTAEAESLRLEREVADLRLRLSALEGGGTRLALQPGPSEDPRFSSAPQVEQPQQSFPAAPLDDSLWLPPRAASEHSGFGGNYRGAPLPVRSPAADSRVSWFRILLLAGELLFIGLAAFLAWLADLSPVLAATTVAIAWLLAATLELMRWRSSKTQSQLNV